MKLVAGIEKELDRMGAKHAISLPRLLSRRCTENRAAALFLKEKTTNTALGNGYMNFGG